MKIVQLSPYAMSRPGGVQRHVRDLAAWLQAQGHETRIVAPPAPGDRPRPHDQVTEIGRARSMAMHGTSFEFSLCTPWSARRLARELRGWGADLVHMHTPWTPLTVGLMWRALRLPTVTTIHATLPDLAGRTLGDRYIRRAARFFLRRSQAVVTPSEAPLPLLRELVPSLDLKVLPPAIDLSDWRAARHPRPAGAPLRLAFLGRLEARKGVEVALETWRILSPRLPGATLTIAGDGALRGAVEAAAARPGSRFTYAGRLDDTDARRLLAGADLFLAPAPFGESFGIVLAEAMAAGAVPVAAANPGYASVMTGPGAELLVRPGDATALAAKVEELAANPEKITEYRDWAITHADHFDIAQAGPRYLELYHALI